MQCFWPCAGVVGTGVQWRVLYHTDQILAQARHSWAFSALLLNADMQILHNGDRYVEAEP